MSQATPTSIPYNGSGTINIHINNPSANVAPAGMPVYNPYAYAYPPASYPGFAYPPNYYISNNNVPQNTQPPVTIGSTPVAAAPAATADNKKREVVVLTDNYIKTLEQCLKNNNAEVRKDAAANLLKRFKEDKSRASDPALTALLNIALQDQNQAVKSLAMAAVQTGYAKGDNLTKQILGNIEKSKSNYGQDANQSISAMLKLAEEKQTVDDNSHYDQNQQVKNKSKG
ncbi:MAG: hypothetical protein PHX18_02110 [Candidatus Gastranaerophilales bacterium]|nr:hypothetical protein [Candidatus Gastranaerophilales bacterium]